MRLHAMMTGACLAALMLTGAPAAAQSLEDGFRNPPKEARPRFRWWWPGGAVNDAEIEREIGVIDAAGFGGAEIQALAPNFATLTPDEKARVNDYAEPAFFGHVRAAAKAASARW